MKNYFKDKLPAAILFAFIFTIVPILYLMLYYSFAPIESISELHSFNAPDITIEDTQQVVTFNRSYFVEHEATIIRELNLVNNETRQVVYRKQLDFHAIPAEGETIQVVYDIDEGVLTVGEYFWNVGFVRKFSYGVTRNDYWQSNVFNVTDNKK